MITTKNQYNIYKRICESYKTGEVQPIKDYYKVGRVSELFPYDKLKNLRKADFAYLILYLCMKRDFDEGGLVNFLRETPKKKLISIIKTKEFIERYEITIRKDKEVLEQLNEDADIVDIVYKAYRKGAVSPFMLYYVLEKHGVKGRIQERLHKKLKVFFGFLGLDVTKLIEKDCDGTNREVQTENA